MFKMTMSIIQGLIFIISGKIKFLHLNTVSKDEKYVFVGRHTSNFDPVFMGIALKQHKLMFMAKKELFFFGFGQLISALGAFPVDRKNPGSKVIKYPVKKLKNNEASLVIFPTGSRSSSDIKGGAALIAKLSGKQIIPVVYSGPETFFSLFSRKEKVVSFGEPIDLSGYKKLDSDALDTVGKLLQISFDNLQMEIDDDYDKTSKLFTRE